MALAFLAGPAPARADRPAPPGDDHLAYGSACGSPDALRVVIDATPKGPRVTVTRGGGEPGPYATLDVNFAHFSRRLFFKAKTPAGLIEFQGHARPNVLAGLFSDDRGRTREIALPSDERQSRDCNAGDQR